MMFTIEEVDNFTSTVTVDPDYTMPNGASCQGHVARTGANCPLGALYAVSFVTDEYRAQEFYCDRHIGDGVTNYLLPEPGSDGC